MNSVLISPYYQLIQTGFYASSSDICAAAIAAATAYEFARLARFLPAILTIS